MAVQSLLDGEAERITRALIDAALGGDPAALRLCMERLIPPRKTRPVNIDLPATDTPESCGRAMDRVLEAVAGGVLLPDEGRELLALLEIRRRGFADNADDGLEARWGKILALLGAALPG